MGATGGKASDCGNCVELTGTCTENQDPPRHTHTHNIVHNIPVTSFKRGAQRTLKAPPGTMGAPCDKQMLYVCWQAQSLSMVGAQMRTQTVHNVFACRVARAEQRFARGRVSQRHSHRFHHRTRKQDIGIANRRKRCGLHMFGHLAARTQQASEPRRARSRGHKPPKEQNCLGELTEPELWLRVTPFNPPVKGHLGGATCVTPVHMTVQNRSPQGPQVVPPNVPNRSHAWSDPCPTPPPKEVPDLAVDPPPPPVLPDSS